MIDELLPFDRVIPALYGNLVRNAGIPDGRIAAAERRLGLLLPNVLRHFYSRYGASEALRRAHERLLEPEELYLKDGTLVICEENQGECLWGLSAEEIHRDDPRVLRATNESSLQWEQDHELLTGFLVTLAYWQAVNGALGNCAVALKVDPGVDAAVESRWKEIPIATRAWGVRFFGAEGQLLCLIGPSQIGAAGRTPEDLEAIRTALGIEWDYEESADA